MIVKIRVLSNPPQDYNSTVILVDWTLSMEAAILVFPGDVVSAHMLAWAPAGPHFPDC